MRHIAYYRVSTARQGQSGLGLDAQRNSVREYLGAQGSPECDEYTEIESGRNNHRPELKKALRACRIFGARLVIARLDRLARNASFLINLREAGVDFIAVDMPEANRLTVGIMALIAEEECTQISRRTKLALAEAKRRGVKLGNPENLLNRALGTINSARVRAVRAEAFARDAMSVIHEIRAGGINTLSGISAELTRRGIPTAQGKSKWGPMQIKRVEARAS